MLKTEVGEQFFCLGSKPNSNLLALPNENGDEEVVP
jgi:hypothetical protein